jgi:pimeloyl-ACP methyl ester carboxylesterase
MTALSLVLLSLGALHLVSPSFQKQTVELSTGISMRYVERGNSAGEVVILLHGITDTSRSFYPMMERLTELRPDLRLIALDQRGHGDSSLPAGAICRSLPERCFRPEDFASDVLAFMDQKDIERAHIVGHSMGSAVAQQLALDRPDRVARLVLIASFASTVAHPPLRDFLLADRAEGAWKEALVRKGHRFPEEVYELTPLDADPDAEEWMLDFWVSEPAADPEFLKLVARDTSRVAVGTWIGAARALLAFDNREALANLSVPTLVLWPTQDVFFPRSYQTELLSSLDRAAGLCNTSYFFKEYGTKPLPASGLQENELGHNLHWGAFEPVALDLASWLRESGRPTEDHYFADPADVRRVVAAKGKAVLIEGAARNCATTDRSP